MTTNQPAPQPAEEPTSDEQERLLKRARAAQVAGTFPSDSAIRLLTDGYGADESERRHCMAAARLALAYWGHTWGCLDSNQPVPVEPAVPPAEGEVGELVADLEVAAASYFNRGFVTDARRCRRAAALIEQQAAELAECREALRQASRLLHRISGGGW